MARPLRIQYPGAFYHVTSRGNERQDIFRSTADREMFLGYLESAACRYGAVIHAYCLMTNHYHLLLETPGGNLSEIMRHINGAYTTCFNVKRRRAGHLFQGRYKAILVEADSYAAELSRYIHLNPVRAGMVAAPQDYRWSSYPAYVGLDEPAGWLKTDFVLSLLTQESRAAQSRYRNFVEALFDTPCESPLSTVTASSVLGGEQFIQEVMEKYAGGTREEAQLSAMTSRAQHPSIEDVFVAVQAAWEGRDKLARKIAIYLSHRLTGATLKQIGARFGLTESGVAQSSRRLSDKLVEDKGLSEQLAAMEKSLTEGRTGLSGRSNSGLVRERTPKDDAGGPEILLRRISDVLDDYPEVKFSTLFGSAGRGRMTSQSDVDVAVAGEQKLTVEIRARLSLALSEALGREIDLIDLQEVSGLILEQALCRAQVVKNADTALYARLLKRLWYNQSDMMPYVKRILEERSRRWLR